MSENKMSTQELNSAPQPNPSNPLPYRLKHRIRVRWSEVDLQKVVFNPHYLTYFDIAVSQYWRELALPYELTLRELEGDIFVKKASLEYNGSAHFDETLTVCLRCSRIGRSSLTFNGSIFRDSETLILCEIVYVFADPVKKISKPVPQVLKDALSRYEAGEPVTKLSIGSWEELREDALALRKEVFVLEQGVPPEMEEDELDQDCKHAVLYNALNLPIATARLISNNQPGKQLTGKVGRMVVRRELRGTHWGAKVLCALEGVARARGDKYLSLSAQLQAQGFYEKQGFRATGDIYEEAGIAHIEMCKSL